MRRLLLPFILVVSLLASPGCVGHIRPDGTPVSPTEDATITGNDAVTAAVKIIDGAVKAKILKPTDVEPWLPIRNAARAAAKAAKVEFDAGNVEGAKIYANAARAAVDRLQPLLIYIAERKAAKQ